MNYKGRGFVSSIRWLQMLECHSACETVMICQARGNVFAVPAGLGVQLGADVVRNSIINALKFRDWAISFDLDYITALEYLRGEMALEA